MKFVAPASFLLLAALVQAQASFDKNKFPAGDAIPPVNSTEMKAWLAEIDFSDVPAIARNPVKSEKENRAPADCAKLPALKPDACLWTCQTCLGENEVETCPDPNDWGLTFDDGPKETTVPLLQVLKDANVKATFFVMGTNAVQNPDILKRTLAEGHHIASHTWSHSPLTTMSNEEIVAEVKWAEKAVLDITGLKMKYIRPPYGDIDNRVRKILSKLGYRVINWTRDFDTLDYKLTTLTLKEALVEAELFQKKVLSRPPTAVGGIISLQHDIHALTTDYTRKMLEVTTQPGFRFKVKHIADCLNDKNGYQSGVPPVVPGEGKNNGTTGGEGGKGANPQIPGDKDKSAAGTLEFSLVTAGAAALAALAGSMGMLL
ncbi:chitin deacetylase [Actinomortierella ambigua]|uniref:Chitin deacetylase n=1 Tax=Actinomortierella ambigua TaxID=1343610 RepID=A0A9P6QP05_9FUNG|nr:chitin deacetylase [Actinomortierella ambigua]